MGIAPFPFPSEPGIAHRMYSLSRIITLTLILLDSLSIHSRSIFVVAVYSASEFHSKRVSFVKNDNYALPR